MSRHEGVSCDSCLKGNFRGRRYKCLICYDYDLCATCYEAGATTTRHTTEHPMQCILTRSDFDLYYGGEALTVEQPQAFTCPYCGKMGFTETTLQEHVTSEHSETSFEVVCPVCASLPGGDPNLVTDDFAGHLTLEHRIGPRDLISFLDEPVGSRHGGRRIPHASRGVGGPRARRSNMHFSSSGGLSSLSPSSRESVDPIAELLSQLSGVRRSAAGQGSTPSQLQQLQMQLQLERQQAAARQQLERLPRRQTQTASSTNSAGAGTATAATTAATGSHTAVPLDATLSQAAPSNSQFLLSRCMDSTLTDLELQSVEQERADRSLFVQELVLATLTEGAASLLLDGLSPDCASGSRKESEEVSSRASPGNEGSSNGNSGSPRASPSTSSASETGPQQQTGLQQHQHQQQKSTSLMVPKRSSSRNSGNLGGAASLALLLPRQQQLPAGASSSSLAAQQQPSQHHDLRGGIRSNVGGGGGGLLASQQQQQQQPPVRVVTGTGTIREVVPSTAVVGGGYGGRGGSVRGGAGASSPGPTRRKPVRPLEGRNQSTEPPPPH